MCSRLFLVKELAGSHVPHFLGFIRRHSGSLSDLNAASGFLWLEMVLATLLTHQAPISRVSGHIAGEAIHLLAALKTVTHCCLSGQQETPMSLQPLKALPHLISLDLAKGQFTHVDAAAQHLTTLNLRDCKARCFEDCLCVTSLKHLYCRHSDLQRFHQQGLPACSQLESLVCESSNIHAVDDADSVLFGGPDHCVPFSLSALTSLTSLSFCCDAQDIGVELDWLIELTALESFEAKLEAQIVLLPECLSSMSSLRRLSIGGPEMDELARVTFDFDFRHLVALEELCVHGNFVAETSGLLNLTALKKLRVVDFSCFTEPDRQMMGQLALLAHRLGEHRPDIRFTADNDWLYA